MVEGGGDDAWTPDAEKAGKCGKKRGRVSPPSRTTIRYAAAAFGRRPRRAAACPGMFAAQSSQRSACLAPRRASVKLRRKTAPLPSPTSLAQLSQTSTVFRANVSSFKGVRKRHRIEKDACKATQPRVRVESARSAASSAMPVPPDRVPYPAPARRADAGGGSPRSCVRPGIARRRPG